MIKILRKAHFYWYMSMVALVFFIMYPVFFVLTRKPEWYAYVGWWRWLWCSIAFLLGGYWHRIEYEEEIDFSRPMVIVANHSSFLDTPLMCLVITGNYHFLGKVELLKNPVLRLFFQTIDVPIDRQNRMAGFRALKRVEQNIKGGMSLVLYPEGTMSRTAPEMGEFKAGAFKLAVDTKTPILPVTFVNNYDLLLTNGIKSGSKPGIMEVYVHKPILTSNVNTAEEMELLSTQVYDTVKSKIRI